MTSMRTKATASASVTWNPRIRRLNRDSGSASLGARAAMTEPTTSGTKSARAIQTMRSARLGTDFDSGTKETTKSIAFGKTTPARRNGQAAAAATTAESSVCSLGEVRPKSASTAQPNAALRIFPADLAMRLMRAWRIAMAQS